MMKNLLNSLAITILISSSLISLAQASGTELDDVVFATPPTLSDVACGGGQRNVTYNLQNNEANTITLYDVQMITLISDTSKVTIVPVSGGCLTSVTNNIGAGSIPGFGTCVLSFSVTPPACTGGPLQTPIARQLLIGVQSQEGQLVANLNANVTVVGSGDSFSVLGGTVANNSQGASQIIGNIGYLTTSGGIDLINGKAYIGAADPTRTAAESDFKAAYSTLLTWMATLGTGCEPRTSIDPGDVLEAGYYCLQQNPVVANTAIRVGGATDTITLVGDGTGKANFYFFVDSQNTATCKNGAAVYRCDLDVLAGTTFSYLNGASPANVYWIMGSKAAVPPVNSGRVLLRSNSKFDGTVLQGATGQPSPSILATATGTSPTLVNGRLWALSTATTLPAGNIQLFGNTVAHP